MANAIVQDRRADRAAGIVERHEVRPHEDRPGWWYVKDSVTGSCRWHLTSAHGCDCYDARKGACKHQIAVRREEAALAVYAAEWDRAAQPTCPMCDCRLVEEVYYIGGRGLSTFLICSGDGSHPARRID